MHDFIPNSLGLNKWIENRGQKRYAKDNFKLVLKLCARHVMSIDYRSRHISFRFVLFYDTAI